jgi:hypothetical protein
MNDQVTGIIRAVLAALGGFILAKGWVNAETWAWITGGVLTVGPAIWSWFNNRPSTQAATVQAMPGVEVTTTHMAPPGVAAAVQAVKNSQ